MNQRFARHDLLRGRLSADPRAGAERAEAVETRAESEIDPAIPTRLIAANEALSKPRSKPN